MSDSSSTPHFPPYHVFAGDPLLNAPVFTRDLTSPDSVDPAAILNKPLNGKEGTDVKDLVPAEAGAINPGDHEHEFMRQQMMASFPPHHLMNQSHAHANFQLPWPYHPEHLPPTVYAPHMLSPMMGPPRPPQPALHRSLSDASIPIAGTPIQRATTPKPGPKYGMFHFRNKPELLGDRSTWTPQELHDSRRIINFGKQQVRDAIHIYCEPIPQEHYIESMITISCVYCVPHALAPEHPNKEKTDQEKRYAEILGKCIFTSVDIIMLLEKIVNNTFDVQEKNRIRRNLEGYHPVTIKKEGDTLPFFNQLMSYSQPKTRNIEKDIKVFPWECISKAMKTIFTKYTENKRDRSTSLPSTRGTSSVPRSVPAAIPYGGSHSQDSFLSGSQSSSMFSSSQTSLLSESCSQELVGEDILGLGILGGGSLASSSEGLEYIPGAVLRDFNLPL